ncbi:regulatory protein RecX [Sphingobium sp. AN641]|uniref:regulatory protein RecX n=1 Tax=Sphingobium sp. AN641 TaxID=3133443 RepID=UPI0030C07990
MTPKRPRPPLDSDKLRDIALHYVGRYATSRAKLLAYLDRKLRERGWNGDTAPDPQGLVERFAQMGYIDDAGFAAMKGAAMARRGYGAQRVAQALRGAGIADKDRELADAQADAARWSAAEAFARRKRVGPYAAQVPDRAVREKLIAAFLRAGHGYEMARKWVDAAPGEPPQADDGEGE